MGVGGGVFDLETHPGLSKDAADCRKTRSMECVVMCIVTDVSILYNKKQIVHKNVEQKWS